MHGNVFDPGIEALIAGLDRHNFSLGPFDAWPPALKVSMRMMLASQFPMFIAWGEDFPYLYNAACIPIVGARHPFAFGRPFKEVWPEVWDDLAPLLHRALAGEASYREKWSVELLRDGRMQPAWFTFSYSPLFDEAGAVRGLLSVAVEETATVVASVQQGLREELARLLGEAREPQAMADAATTLLAGHLRVDICRHHTIDEDGLETLAGLTDAERNKLQAGTAVVRQTEPALIVVPQFEAGQLRAVLWAEAAGARRWSSEDLGFVREVKERIGAAATRLRGENDLRQSERRLSQVLESVSDGFFALDSDWRFTVFNRACEVAFASRREDVVNKVIWDVFPATRGSELQRQLQSVAAEQVPRNFDSQSMAHPGQQVEIRAAPKEGGGVAVSFSDVTARKRAEEHRQLLTNELNHRVKNSLAVVQGLAAQSFRDGMTIATARRAFEGRLMALAAAHTLLTTQSWKSAPLSEVVEDSVSASTDRTRFTISGPAVFLQPQTAVSLALAVHELCTNAVKYGALTLPAGQVSVSWEVSKSANGKRLRFVWQESGGPPVSEPDTRGFGSRLLERGLARDLQGSVELAFAPAGLCCRIDAPLPVVAD